MTSTNGTMMDYHLEHAIAILERTPASLSALLSGLPDVWVMSNEGGDSWSPYDVVGHLYHLERVGWVGGVHVIRKYGTARAFKPINRTAMFQESQGKSLQCLLDEFATLRQENIATLQAMKLTDDDLSLTGTHDAFGEVTMAHLLATWVVHDLNHLHQIAQTMSRQYDEAVGPWRETLHVLDH